MNLETLRAYEFPGYPDVQDTVRALLDVAEAAKELLDALGNQHAWPASPDDWPAVNKPAAKTREALARLVDRAAG